MNNEHCHVSELQSFNNTKNPLYKTGNIAADTWGYIKNSALNLVPSHVKIQYQVDTKRWKMLRLFHTFHFLLNSIQPENFNQSSRVFFRWLVFKFVSFPFGINDEFRIESIHAIWIEWKEKNFQYPQFSSYHDFIKWVIF